MNTYIITVIMSLFILSMLTRALPFMFTKQLAGNIKMQVLGKRLSAYIMMLLVIYEINPVSFKTYPFAVPAILSLLVVILTHIYMKSKRLVNHLLFREDQLWHGSSSFELFCFNIER